MTRKLSLDAFRNQEYKGMTRRTVTELFGSPDRDEGSGMFIYVYRLKAGDLIKVGCGIEVLYVRHTDENGVQLDELY